MGLGLTTLKYSQEDLVHFTGKAERIKAELSSLNSEDSNYKELSKLLQDTEKKIQSIISQNEELKLKELTRPLFDIVEVILNLNKTKPVQVESHINSQIYEHVSQPNEQEEQEEHQPTLNEIDETITKIESLLSMAKENLKVFNGALTEEEIQDIKNKNEALSNPPAVTFTNDLSDYVANRKTGKNIGDFFEENLENIRNIIIHYNFNFDLVVAYLANLGLSNGEKVAVKTFKGYCSQHKIPVNQFKLVREQEDVEKE